LNMFQYHYIHISQRLQHKLVNHLGKILRNEFISFMESGN
jgi:hypothetical protein